MKNGFDNDKYLKIQSEHIKERISKFGGKLYLEFGGKLFDDYHAARVLPGFQPDSKLQMLMQLSDMAEIVIVISAEDIATNKVRGDLEITYDEDVFRLCDEFENRGLMVGSVVITHYIKNPAVDVFVKKLKRKKINCYFHRKIAGYPHETDHILSDEGFGLNDYVETSRKLVVVTAPGPGSGKMATCLSQLYHENKRGIKAGYAKFETFPIWNLPLKHPVNLAYEAATADLNDVNMIDHLHWESYGVQTVNYNRDIDIFPVLRSLFIGIYGKSPYKSPTDMGVNMAGNCIYDDKACQDAAKQEIIRRFYNKLCRIYEDTGEVVENFEIEEKKDSSDLRELKRIYWLMKNEKISTDERKVIAAAKEKAKQKGEEYKKSDKSKAFDEYSDKLPPSAAIELNDGTILTSSTSELFGACAALILKALKYLAGIDQKQHIIPTSAIEPIQEVKVKYLMGKNPRLHSDELLVALAIVSVDNEDAKRAVEQLPKLKGTQVHSSVMLSEIDRKILKKLGIDFTSEPVTKKTKIR